MQLDQSLAFATGRLGHGRFSSLVLGPLPQKSPWFEGWYTRISETPSGQSVGLIVEHYPEKAELSDAAAYLALIIDEGKGKTTVVEANPPGLTVLKHGAAIANEPDDASWPDFEVSAGNGTLMMKQTGTQQRISMWFPRKASASMRISRTLSHGVRPESRLKAGPEGCLSWLSTGSCTP